MSRIQIHRARRLETSQLVRELEAAKVERQEIATRFGVSIYTVGSWARGDTMANNTQRLLLQAALNAGWDAFCDAPGCWARWVPGGRGRCPEHAITPDKHPTI